MPKQLGHWLGYHITHQCLGCDSGSVPDSSILRLCTLGGSGNGSGGWAPGLCAEDLDGVSSFLLWPVPDPMIVGLGGVNQQCVCSVCLPLKSINI